MDSKKPIRFEAGKKLNEAEKKEMYKSLKDSYRENNRPYTIEDDKLVWLDDSAPYMTKSDITERMLRWYIILPDGKIAHPTEVFGASVQLSDLERVQKNIESNEFWAKKYYDEVSAELEKKGETEKVVDAINKAKANGAELKGEYSSDDVGKRHKRVRLVFDNGNNVSVPEYVINIEGSYLGLTKEDWVKQKIGEGKNRFLHFNWAEIDWEKFHSENFNWLDVFRESTPEEEAAFKLKQETEAKNEKENWYQQSKWSKKYAPTYKDAVEKMKKEYLDGKKTFEDWGSRVYKSNKGVVFAGGDDIHGEAYTIGGINEHRKKNRMMGAKMQMDEAIANLKELGVPESEITELIEQKENKGIVEPVNEWAIEINQIYNQWLSVKNENDWKKWKENVKSKKYGTYKNKDILDILDNFEPKYPNEIIKKDWITELHKALDITLPLHLKGQMQKAIDNKIEVKENKEMTKEIKEGQVYLNTTNNKKVQIDKVEGNEAEFPSVYYHIFGEEKSYRNSNIDRLSLFEDLVEKGAFVLIDSELEKGKAVEMEHKETLEKVATGEITPEEGVLETAETHIAEDPKYYDKLDAIEMSPEKQAELKSFKQRVELLLRREYSKTTTDKLMEENNSMIEDDFSLLRTADRTFREIQEAHEKPQKEKYNSLISNSGINSERIDNWNQVPVVWKNTKPISKVNFVNTPYNKELIKLLDVFAGNDALRPVMSGIHFDGNGITATNAHKLISLPYPNPEYNGTYATIPKRDYSFDKDIKGDLFTSTKYPNYPAVIPIAESATNVHKFSVYKALQYTRVALKFTNKYTHAIAFSFGDTVIAFNGEYLEEVLETILKLGHEELFSFTNNPNRAIVLSPDRNYELGKSEIFLLMPVLIVNENENYKGGAEDLDFAREINVYYDFSTDAIYNSNGTLAEFKMNYGEYDILKPAEIKALDKYAGNNPTIFILENFKVEDGKVFASNLETGFTIKDSNLKDGLYKVLNGAIEYDGNQTLSSYDDFPKIKIEGELQLGFVINSEILKFYIEKAIEFTGDEDIRPVMKGICFDYNNGQMFMVATDAHKLFKVEITEYIETNAGQKDFQFILSQSNLMKFLKVLDESPIEVKAYNKNVVFDTDDYNFTSKTIDGRYPNYNGVISAFKNKKITINVKDLFICLKSKEAQDFIKKHKKEDVMLIDRVGSKENELDLYLFVFEDTRDNSSRKIEDEVKICTVKYKYEEGTYQTHSNVMLLMPIMNNEDAAHFAFREKFFREILDVVNCEDVEIFYDEKNRAYLIDGDCFKYKHTIQAVKKSPIKASVVEEVRTEKEIVEQEEKDKEVIEEQFNEPDADLIDSRTTGAGTSDAEDAIVLLNDLLEDAKGKQKKTILEAINLLKDLL